MQSSTQEKLATGRRLSTQGKLTSRYLVEQTHLLSSTRKILHIYEDAIELFSMHQEKLEQIDFGSINKILCNDHNEKEFTIITNTNQHNIFSCNQRNKLLTEVLKHFDPFSKQEKEGGGESSTIKWQEKDVIQQRDIYYEEASSVDGTFQVHNSSIFMKYNHKEYYDGEMFQGPQNSQKKSPNRKWVNGDAPNGKDCTIYYIDMESLLSYDSTLYIIKHNSDVEKFIFPSAEKLAQTISNILKNSKAYLNLKLEYIDAKKEEHLNKNLQSKINGGDQFDEKTLLDLLYKKVRKTNVLFRTEGHIWLMTNQEQKDGVLEVTEDAIYLSELVNQNMRMMGYLKELHYIIVEGHSTRGQVTLIFIRPSGAFIEMSIESDKRDDLITTLLCLRSLLKMPYNSLMIFSHKPDFSQIIQGLLSSNIDIEYEQQLFKKVCDSLIDDKKGLAHHSEPYYFRYLNELIFNTDFYNLTRLDAKSLRDFSDEVKKTITDYIKQEEEMMDLEDDDFDFSEDSDAYDTESDQESLSDEEGDDENEYAQSPQHSLVSNESVENKEKTNTGGADMIEWKNEMEKPNEFEMLTQKLSYLLCILKIILNGKQVFRELLVDYQDLIHKVIKLLGSRNIYISYMGSQIIYSLVHFYDRVEHNAESLNKNSLIKSLSLMKYIKRGFSRHDQLYQKKGIVKSLYIWSLYELLTAFLCDRKESTSQENYWDVIREIFDKKDLKLLHIIDRFSMTPDFALTYGFTKIINELFKFLQKGDTNKFKEMQKYFLVYTVQFIYNIYLVLSSPLEAQRSLSIIMISKIAYKNKQAVNILTKIFRKSLFSKVKTPLELFSNYNWEEEILNELLVNLKAQVDLFIEAKIDHQKALSKHHSEEQTLTHPTHEFARNKQIVSKVRNLRWNYDQLNLKQSDGELRVQQYYLSKLLDEGNQATNYIATLKFMPEQFKGNNVERNNDILGFWDELKQQFMPSEDDDERKLILKVMIILYQTEFEVLKELKTLPYWLKLLEFPEFSKCQFLLLQLILQSLSIKKDDIVAKNSKIFIESDGLRIVFTCLKQIFSDLDSREAKRDHIEENQVSLEFAQIQKAKNYTDYFHDAFYFKYNNREINIGILCFRILDLIMSRDTNKQMDPLSKNKSFILQPDNVSVIASLLLLQNNPLTKEIIGFIEKHLDSHYTLYQFRKSGLIEFLILYLDSELVEEAYRLLMKMQEVTADYNDDIDLDAEFDQNDINIIQYDRASTSGKRMEEHVARDDKIQKNSIFLRYLPFPLIKKAHQSLHENTFIKIYQLESYEKATLIWNREMKEKLKDSILQNSANLRAALIKFAHKINTKKDSRVPRFQGPVQNIITFPFIENEIKCGQYYLSVWTSQRSKHKLGEEDDETMKIPVNEEQLLMDKLKLILESLIQKEEEVSEQRKLIILLRSCLLALQTFQKKRLNCLQQVKDIMYYLCKVKDLDYNDSVKEALYIGMKTIFTAIDIVKVKPGTQIWQDTRNQEQISHDKKQNLKEVLGFNGIHLINEVISMILCYSKLSTNQGYSKQGSLATSHLQMSSRTPLQLNDRGDESYDLPMNLEERSKLQSSQSNPNSLKLDKLEAKTLLYSAKAMHILIEADIEKYLDNTLVFRITLFKQLSNILQISYSVYQAYKKKSTTSYDKNKNMPYQVPPTPIGAGLKASLNQKLTTITSSQQSQKMSFFPITTRANQNKAFVFGQSSLGEPSTQQQEPDRQVGYSNEHDFKNFYKDQLMRSPSKHMDTANLLTVPTSNQPINLDSSYANKKVQSKQKGNFKLKINFSDDYVSMNDRKKVLSLIFAIAQSILSMGRDLSLNLNIHPELIKSGFAWRALQHFFFSMIAEFKQNQDVVLILRDSVYTLQHLTSFSKLFIHSSINASTLDSKLDPQTGIKWRNLQAKEEREIILEFQSAIKRLFEDKILQFLECTFDLDREKQVMKFTDHIQDKGHFNFLKTFSIPEERTPELVWNEQSRQELAEILQDQISCIDKSFYDQIKTFEYSINRTELRIENIYVKNINSDIYFRATELNKFVEGLIKALKSLLSSHHILQFDEQKFDNVLEIIKAFRNLIQYQNTQILSIITSTNNFNFEDTIGLLCSILKVKSNEYSEEGETRFKTISSIVFDIIKIISKTQKFAEYLVNSLKFTKLLTRAFSFGDREIFDNDGLKKLVSILSNILNYETIESEKFLIKNGLVIFLLNVLIDKGFNTDIKKEIAKLLFLKIEEVGPTLGAFIPIQFFTFGDFLWNQPMTQDETIEQLLECLDDLQFENQFIIWNSDLRDKQHNKIKQECERVISQLKTCNNFETLDVKISVQPYVNPRFAHEVIIQDVIVRAFNKNPTLFINTSLEQFLESLSLKMGKLAITQSQILQLLQNNEVDFQAENGDQLIDVNGNIFTSKQVRKKLKQIIQQSLYVFSAILLSLEQILYNDYNPNKRRADVRPSVLGGGTKVAQVENNPFQQREVLKSASYTRASIHQTHYQHQLDMLQGVGEDAKNIPEIFYQFIEEWLRDRRFESDHIPIELRLTFLQLLYLVLEIPSAFKRLRDELLKYLNDEITKIPKLEIAKTIEQIFILVLTQKVMKIGGIEAIEQIFEKNYENLVSIHSIHKTLSSLVEYMLVTMTKCQKYKDYFIQLSRQSDYVKDREMKINWKDILSQKLDQNSEHNEGILKLWRARPLSISEAKRFYMLTENQFIENKQDESNINKLKMPLIGKKSTEELKKEDLMGEDELNSSTLIECLEILQQKENSKEGIQLV